MSAFDTSLLVACVLLSLCAVLTLIRFLIGPTLPDRVTAFDLFASNVIGITAIYAVLTQSEGIVDVAFIVSLFAFLGTISFGYFLMKKINQNNKDKSK